MRPERKRRAAFGLRLAPALCLLPLLAAAQALSPELSRQLAVLPEADRDRVLAQARLWAGLSPERRQALRREIAEWDALPLAERRARRAAWATWQALPEPERARLRRTAATYARMPDAQREELAARYAALDAFERGGWRLGPVLGADWPQLHGLLALVPEAQRLPMLSLLRDLDARARADLALVARRTPPAERDALRRKLLSMPAAARADWLRGQAMPE